MSAKTVAAVIAVAFGYVMFSPVAHNPLLYSLFFGIGLLSFVVIVRTNRHIDGHLLALVLLIGSMAAYGIAIGMGNPGLLFTIAVYLAAPGLYLLCVAAATFDALRYFVTAAVVATIVTSALLLVFVAGEAGPIPQIVPSWLRDFTGLVATFRDGGTQARSWGLSSLAALGPLWMGSLFLSRDRLLPPFLVRLTCAALSTAAAFVSNRNAILIVIVLAPFIAVVLGMILTARHARWFAIRAKVAAGWLLAAAIVLGGVLLLVQRLRGANPIANVVASVQSFFSGTSTPGADESIRADQVYHLINAWSLNPIFGSGLGARVPNYARTSEMPWVLELQYHYTLFTLGLVGVAFLIAIGIVALALVRKAANVAPQLRSSFVAFSTGALAMVIANATNPYLQAPGHMWALFLPLALACVVLRGGHTSPDPLADVTQTASHPQGALELQAGNTSAGNLSSTETAAS